MKQCLTAIMLLLYFLPSTILADQKEDIKVAIDTMLKGFQDKNYTLIDSVCVPDGSVLTHDGLKQSWQELKIMLPKMEKQYEMQKKMLECIDKDDVAGYYWTLNALANGNTTGLEEFRSAMKEQGNEIMAMLEKSMRKNRKTHERLIACVDGIFPFVKSIGIQDIEIHDNTAIVIYSATGARGSEKGTIVMSREKGRWLVRQFNLQLYEEAKKENP